MTSDLHIYHISCSRKASLASLASLAAKATAREHLSACQMFPVMCSFPAEKRQAQSREFYEYDYHDYEEYNYHEDDHAEDDSYYVEHDVSSKSSYNPVPEIYRDFNTPPGIVLNDRDHRDFPGVSPAGVEGISSQLYHFITSHVNQVSFFVQGLPPEREFEDFT